MAERLPEDPMVELTTCTTPYESELVQGLLREADIQFQADEMSSQFAFTAGAAATARIRVARSDLERARHAISFEGHEEDEEAITETEEELAEDRKAARERRYRIARWFLVINGALYTGTAVLAAALGPVETVLHAAVGIASFVLVSASLRNPRQAFLFSFLMIAATMLWGMYGGGLVLVLPGFGVLLASYFAHQAAVRADLAASAAR